jgi:predicted aspartyl protease/Flp pilus assembly protein TadD
VFAAFVVCFSLLFVHSNHALSAPVDAKLVKNANRALREWRFEVAETLYREALVADAGNAKARLGLSFALLKQRKLQEAYEQAMHVLNADPRRARAHAVLGTILVTIGDFDSAARYFRTALALDEREALAMAGLGMIDFYENRVENAFAKLERAVTIDSINPDYIFSFAQTAARHERYRIAADAYERFLRVAPRTDEDRRDRIRGLIDFLRFLSTQGKLYEIAGAARTEVEFELASNRPIIKIRINDKTETLRFVLDTGSSMCVIAEETARRLGVRAIATGGKARAVGGAGKFDIVYGFLPELAIGDVRARNVPVYIRPFFNKENPVDGYIGLSVITRYVMSVDYQQRRLTLARADKPDLAASKSEPNKSASTANAVPVINQPASEQRTDDPALATPQKDIFELPARLTTGGFWSGEVRLEGVERAQNFIIDTGASISVVSEGLAAREELSRFRQTNQLRIHGAAGTTENVPLLMLPGVALGAHTRPNVPAVVLDMEPINETSGFEQTGILGGNVLRHFRVTFDFERMVIRLEPNKKIRPAPPVKVSLVKEVKK